MLAEPAPDGPGLAWKPVNACIRLLPSVAGKAVFTVEALKSADGALHPVQRALVACHGSQCGFCTPGFAMSLFGLYKNAHRPSRAAVEDALSGNLCRCTGYRPIVDAAQAMYDIAPAGRSRLARPRSRRRRQSGRHAGRRSRSRANCGRWRSATRRRTRPRAAAGSRRARRTTSPPSCAAHPDARIVAGATDVGLWITKQQRDVGDIVYAGDAADLKRIVATPAHLRDRRRVHAGGRVRRARRALAGAARGVDAVRVGADPQQRHARRQRRQRIADRRFDARADRARRDASCSGAAARRASCRSRTSTSPTRRRRCSPASSSRDPRAARAPGNVLVRAYKISKRFEQDISSVFACFALTLDGARIVSARIGCGGVAATPRRATATEAALTGRAWDDATADAAARTLAAEFAPIDDMRATAAYRRAVLANLLRRFRLETGGGAPLTRVEQVAARRSDDVNAPHPPAATLDDAARRGGVGAPVAHDSAELHVSGEAHYTDDLPEPRDTLHVALGVSPVAHGRLDGLDLAAVRAAPGVVDVIAAADIPGVNDVGPIQHDDPIFAARRRRVRRAAGVRGGRDRRARRRAARRSSPASTSRRCRRSSRSTTRWRRSRSCCRRCT